MPSPYQPRRRPHPSQRRGHTLAPRSAFTLIELLIVLSIIGILAGLLLVGVRGATRSARVASVVSDLKNLEKGIADFKLKFNGVDLPSSIRLHETAMGWQGTDAATRRSKSIIQRLWPDFDFTYTWPATLPHAGLSNGQLDINGDGTISMTPLDLYGSECLVFFLGGVCLTYSDSSLDAMYAIEANRSDDLSMSAGIPQGWTPIGFSTNPSFPFSRGGTARVGPFFEFDSSRLVTAGSSRMPGYVDPIPNQRVPYAYASAVSNATGAGYQATDFNTGTGSSLTYVYTDPGGTPLNPRSYQLISPGFDGLFGFGGKYDGEAITGVDPMTMQDRAAERDNIANFSSGELGG